MSSAAGQVVQKTLASNGSGALAKAVKMVQNSSRHVSTQKLFDVSGRSWVKQLEQ
jgi:hypothetical protein